jgi:EmrB/QacA subfamily drug resistance transporter
MSGNVPTPTGGPPEAGKMTTEQRATMAVALVASYIVPFMTSALNLSVTDISTQLNSGATTVTWVVSVSTLIVAMLSVPFGHLADVTDRRRIFLVGAVLFSATSLASALVGSIGWLLFFRALQAIGSAMIFSSNIPLLLNAFHPSKRGRILGYSVTSTYIGLSMGPVLGGFLNAAFGWRSIFIVTFVLSVISLVLAYRYVSKDEVHGKPEQDIPGNILYILMIGTLIFGLSSWRGNWWAKILVAVSVILFIIFVIWEKKAKAPIVQVRLFTQDLGYTLSNLTALLNYGATSAISYMLSIYLQNVKGMPTSTAGLVLISQPIMMALISPFAGRLSERIAPHKLAGAGMAISAVGVFLLSTISPDFPMWRIVTALLILGIGFGFFSSPNTNAVLSCVKKEHYGEANSILSTMRTLGQSASMVIIMYILGAVVGNVVIAKAPPALLTEAIRTSMLVYAFICVIGTVISFVRSKTTKA